MRTPAQVLTRRRRDDGSAMILTIMVMALVTALVLWPPHHAHSRNTTPKEDLGVNLGDDF